MRAASSSARQTWNLEHDMASPGGFRNRRIEFEGTDAVANTVCESPGISTHSALSLSITHLHRWACARSARAAPTTCRRRSPSSCTRPPAA
jgi:hypothetical protein